MASRTWRFMVVALPALLLAATPVRDPRWAEPLEGPGLKNFFRVDAGLYRGAVPKDEGFAELAKLGVKTVVNLRAFHGEGERVRAQGLGYEHISFKVWHPEHEDVRRFVAVMTDSARQPVFVHCQRGADRTGMMVAVYRICVQGWSHDDAIEEMTHGGYAFAPQWTHIVAWVRKFDPKTYPACKASEQD